MTSLSEKIGFIGGGNMASAIIGGLRRQGMAAEQFIVLEPYAPRREKLLSDFGIHALEKSSNALAQAQQIVWAVKPQTFREAAAQVADHTQQALHLSVMAGITSTSMAQQLSTQRIVRAMPNTPALIGKGIAGLFARAAVSASDKLSIEALIATTGEYLWVTDESHLDAVTALSGSGPAYVFFFIEAMMRAGQSMGLTEGQSRALAQSTFAGAAELARQSPESPEVLRQRVTSKGGTTYAAITSMQDSLVGQRFEQALRAAGARAAELGREFG
ncbi:pyrroline-5-carboxylate reductase [Variovorax sp. PCZ-1]|uniref:pyrroline-5-carboxylate reductase n=1 Tax=Variovorax sp. PCZ-1 TaxID=2835533 RepID=UPI001BCB0B10|nr:pyrroline-5-carboxylate reductase [Variovorax sp. PCZ-1]MBS7808676.1 pyrroline-5-carboxylate reductase [Variovorax sp. PCZ-1]